MSQVARGLDYARLAAGHGFELNLAQQTQVQDEYGHIIPVNVWEEILTCTSLYTISETAHLAVPRLAEVENDFIQLSMAATSLYKKLEGSLEPCPSPLDTQAWKDRLPGASKGNLFGLYVELLRWLIAYTALIERSHNEGYYIGGAGTGLWGEWVRSLNQKIKAAGLPAGTSRNSVLPFTRLVSALQKQIASKKHLLSCVRHSASNLALAEALNREVRGGVDAPVDPVRIPPA
jgi:hypothetical protein